VRVGVIVGLEAEARIARRFARDVIAAPGAHALQAAETLASRGCDLLLSFGIAGALVDSLRPGDLVIGTGIVTKHGQFDAAQSMQVNVPHRKGLVYGTDEPIARIDDKKRLALISQCIAVDMESGHVATVANRRGRRAAVLRAIADPASREIPPAALVGLDAKGNTRPGAVLAALLRDPMQLGGVIRVAFDARAAMERLSTLSERIHIV
jgi:adenosylhomocysteine nucleosidase